MTSSPSADASVSEERFALISRPRNVVVIETRGPRPACVGCGMPGWVKAATTCCWSICAHTDVVLAGEFVERLGADLQDESCPPEINRVGRTLLRWKARIVNWHAAQVSNAPTEAMNNLIKRVKRVGFGFRKFAYYRGRALLYAGRPNGDLLATINPAGVEFSVKRCGSLGVVLAILQCWEMGGVGATAAPGIPEDLQALAGTAREVASMGRQAHTSMLPLA